MSGESQITKIQTNKVKGAPEKARLPSDDPLFGSISCSGAPHGRG